MNVNLQSLPLTNEMVETTDAAYLIDEIFVGELLIISFAFVDWDGSPHFDFYGRTKKLETLIEKPINRILVRDGSNSWYHRGIAGLGEDVDEVAHSLKHLIAQLSPKRVVTIGQSMGAYAAILFGQLIGADLVIAFGPLSFLNAQKARDIQDTRWLPVMEDLEADPPPVCYFDLLELCSTSNYSPKIEIFYGRQPDPETPVEVNLDEIHAKRMAALPNCTVHPYEDSAHAIVQYLVERDLMDSVLLHAIFDHMA